VWPIVYSELILPIHWLFAFLVLPIIEYNYHPLRDGRHYWGLLIAIVLIIAGLFLMDLFTNVSNLSYIVYLIATGGFSYTLVNFIIIFVQLLLLSLIGVFEIVCIIMLFVYYKQIRIFALSALQTFT